MKSSLLIFNFVIFAALGCQTSGGDVEGLECENWPLEKKYLNVVSLAHHPDLKEILAYVRDRSLATSLVSLKSDDEGYEPSDVKKIKLPQGAQLVGAGIGLTGRPEGLFWEPQKGQAAFVIRHLRTGRLLAKGQGLNTKGLRYHGYVTPFGVWLLMRSAYGEETEPQTWQLVKAVVHKGALSFKKGLTFTGRLKVVHGGAGQWQFFWLRQLKSHQNALYRYRLGVDQSPKLVHSFPMKQVDQWGVGANHDQFLLFYQQGDPFAGESKLKGFVQKGKVKVPFARPLGDWDVINPQVVFDQGRPYILALTWSGGDSYVVTIPVSKGAKGLPKRVGPFEKGTLLQQTYLSSQGVRLIMGQKDQAFHRYRLCDLDSSWLE